MKDWLLKYRLHRAGADKHETEELAMLARRIERMADVPHLSERKKRDIAAGLGLRPAPLLLRARPIFGMVAALVIGTVLVAQSAQPGSALYGIKRSSEEVIVRVQPSFQSERVERRRNELEYLQQTNAEADKIYKAQEDYQKSIEKAQEDQQKDPEKQQKEAEKVREDALRESDASGSSDDSDSSGRHGRGRDDEPDDE